MNGSSGKGTRSISTVCGPPTRRSDGPASPTGSRGFQPYSAEFRELISREAVGRRRTNRMGDPLVSTIPNPACPPSTALRAFARAVQAFTGACSSRPRWRAPASSPGSTRSKRPAQKGAGSCPAAGLSSGPALPFHHGGAPPPRVPRSQHVEVLNRQNDEHFRKAYLLPALQANR